MFAPFKIYTGRPFCIYLYLCGTQTRGIETLVRYLNKKKTTAKARGPNRLNRTGTTSREVIKRCKLLPADVYTERRFSFVVQKFLSIKVGFN